MEHIKLLTAKSGDQALELAHRTPVDLVLLDIHLPAISGYEVLRRLKSQPLTASVPVVAVSAAATRDDIERGRSAGFDEYLTKPVRLDRLEEIVIKYCHSHRPPRA
ncbi:MAG TPA: response regulator, partial [Turneriella sp.]|nr:response regulator [Turneriella sp.]